MKTAVIVLGPPGSGKSAVTGFFKTRCFVHLEMSDILKEKLVGAEEMMERKLVSDDIINGLLVQKCAACRGDNIVISGAARTQKQARCIRAYLEGHGYGILIIRMVCARVLAAERLKFRVQQAIEAGKSYRLEDLNPKIVDVGYDCYLEHINGVMFELEGLKRLNLLSALSRAEQDHQLERFWGD